MSWHRSQLFSAMGAEAMYATVPQLDMWRLTADQGENCAKVHCDELYVPNGEGFVSRAVRATLRLGTVAAADRSAHALLASGFLTWLSSISFGRWPT